MESFYNLEGHCVPFKDQTGKVSVDKIQYVMPHDISLLCYFVMNCLEASVDNCGVSTL